MAFSYTKKWYISVYILDSEYSTISHNVIQFTSDLILPFIILINMVKAPCTLRDSKLALASMHWSLDLSRTSNALTIFFTAFGVLPSSNKGWRLRWRSNSLRTSSKSSRPQVKTLKVPEGRSGGRPNPSPKKPKTIDRQMVSRTFIQRIYEFF